MVTQSPMTSIPNTFDDEIAAFHREVLREGPMGSSASLRATRDLPKKWLNPGRPADLWPLFENTPGCTGKASYTTFKRVWRKTFSQILAFRPFGTHSCCTDCSLHQAKIRSAQNAKEKEEASRDYRRHLRSQWKDRQLYWKVREKSKQLDGDLLTIIVDGADQAKFRVFKLLGLTSRVCMSPLVMAS